MVIRSEAEEIFQMANSFESSLNQTDIHNILKKIYSCNVFELEQILPKMYAELESVIISRDWKKIKKYGPEVYMIRQRFVEKIGWGLPEAQYMPEIADRLKEFGEGLSIGCGEHAFVEKALAYYDVTIHCTDLEHGGGGVVQMGHNEAVEEYRERVGFVMFIWPMCYDPYAYESLCLAEENGKQFKAILYIGEGDGGCTACDKFHAKISTDYEIVKTWDAKNWEGIRDYVMLYKLKE